VVLFSPQRQLQGHRYGTSEFQNGKWANWKNAGKKLNSDYDIGEMHITADGTEIYFHSSRAGSKGNYDIWVTKKVNGEWQEPQNVEAVNTPNTEGWLSLPRTVTSYGFSEAI
jgi:hypothetical protein